MILTGDDIKQYIAYGGLSFTPNLRPEQYQQNGVDLVLESVDEIVAGRFALGCTREWIHMPNDLMAFVGIRSTWARQGMGMQGLTIIDAGFDGQITLEIIHFGLQVLPVGKRFAHVVFEKLCTPSKPYSGKYQFQRGITAAREDIEEPAPMQEHRNDGTYIDGQIRRCCRCGAPAPNDGNFFAHDCVRIDTEPAPPKAGEGERQ